MYKCKHKIIANLSKNANEDFSTEKHKFGFLSEKAGFLEKNLNFENCGKFAVECVIMG